MKSSPMETLMPATKKRRLLKNFTPDDDDEDARNLMMNAHSCYLPKKNKLKPLGEDAHFICEEQQTIGVADGIGGWAKRGIDSGIYARQLMDNASCLVRDQPIGAVDPKQVLNEAFLKTEAKGSSTACIITLKNNFLHAVNLGDSGFVVIRKGKIVYRSPVQHIKFNRPYQMGNPSGYFPNLAKKIVVKVKPKDVLVAATDGLFDNVHADKIEDVINTCIKEDSPPELTAWTLVNLARRLSSLDDFISPFTQAAVDVGRDPEMYMGGKYDDVTVIVGYIYNGSLTGTDSSIPSLADMETLETTKF